MRLCALLVVVALTLMPARADTIYAALDNGDIVAVDPGCLTSTLVAHTHVRWLDIAFAPNGQLYGSDGAGLFLIDPLSGHSSLIGGFGAFVNGLDFVGGTLYGSGSLWLYSIDLANGGTQRVGGNLQYVSSGDLEWFGGGLYMTAEGTWGDRLLRWNLDTGQPVLVGDIGFRYVYGLAATGGDMFGLTANGEILKIDLDTGAGTLVGSSGGKVNGASVRSEAENVSEPATLLLLGVALAAIGVRVRRAARGLEGRPRSARSH